MTEIKMSSEMTVKLVRHCASDDSVVQAAQVSAKGENNPETASQRLIEALMTGKHGSPFEHNMMTFYVKVPIFVAREWFRHRISSFNEWSGRYSEMLPEFYTVADDRNIVNTGTKMKPTFELTDGGELHRFTQAHQKIQAKKSWESYQLQLKNGVANEVARMVLPLNIYTQFYWTVNARSLMNFLSLRVESDDSTVKSYPQLEIQMGAEQVEAIFAELMPLTHWAFVGNGRVAP